MSQGGRSERLAPLGAAGWEPRAPELLRGERFRLEPHGICEMLDVALDVLRRRFVVLLGVAFALLGARTLVSAALVAAEIAAIRRGERNMVAAYQLADLASAMLAGFLLSAATSRLVYDTLQAKATPLRELASTVVRRFVPLVVTSIVVAIVNTLGLIACVAPGLVTTVRLQLASPAVVLERVGPLAAIRRSWELTRGSFGPIAAALILGWMLFLPFHLAGYGVQDPEARRKLLEPFGFESVDALSHWLPTLAFTLLAAVGAAYYAALIAVVYVEMRVRREGFDLRVQLARVQSAVPAPSAPAPPAPPSGTAAWEGLA